MRSLGGKPHKIISGPKFRRDDKPVLETEENEPTITNEELIIWCTAFRNQHSSPNDRYRPATFPTHPVSMPSNIVQIQTPGIVALRPWVLVWEGRGGEVVVRLPKA